MSTCKIVEGDKMVSWKKLKTKTPKIKVVLQELKSAEIRNFKKTLRDNKVQ